MPNPQRTESGAYRQRWREYNGAQVNEKRLIQMLLYHLCQSVEAPGQQAGRPRLPLRDVLFAIVLKVFSTVAARRFVEDLTEERARCWITTPISFNSISNYLRMGITAEYLNQMIERSSLPLAAVESCMAVDSTGFSTRRYTRWVDARNGEEKARRDWIKVHLVCGVRTHIVTSVIVTDGHESDNPRLRPLIDSTAERFKIAEVYADAGYHGAENMRHVLAKGGTPYIAFKANSTPYWQPKSTFYKQMLYLYQNRRPEFMEHYNRRSNVETTFSMIKAKFGETLRGKSTQAQINESLCKVLCHNLCVLVRSMFELGIDPVLIPHLEAETGAGPRPEPVPEARLAPALAGAAKKGATPRGQKPGRGEGNPDGQPQLPFV